MAAPIASDIRLPDDSGNTGKRVRTQTRDVGGGVLRHEHAYFQVRNAAVLGVYRVGLPQQTVQTAAQNGTATGFLWAHVPSSVTNKKARLRRIRIESQHSSVLATPTAPRVAVVRFTFTGTASGAQLAAAKVDGASPTPVFDLRTAVTGLTPLLGAVLGVAGLAGSLTAIGAYSPSSIEIGNSDQEDEWPIFAPGDGFVLYQDTAGSSSDTRKINVTMIWDEIDTA